jgi:putative ABC transport system permease protein
MLPFAQLLLAWRNLTHDKRRFVVSVAGIALAVILIFVELGFWYALVDSSVSLLRQFNGELIMVNKARYAMIVREPFTVRRLLQAQAVPGVHSAFPVYIEERLSLWRDPDVRDRGGEQKEPNLYPIRVIAFNPAHDALRNDEIEAKLDLLRLPDRVLIDRRSKKEYGKREANLTRELAGRSIEVVGTFALGTDFTSDGNVVTSDRTFARLFPHRLAPEDTLHYADVGVIQIEAGYDPAAVLKQLKETLPKDVSVYTRDDFVAMEASFWQKATPIGFVFTCGLAMGLIVGMVICSQILSADVTDHLKEYATLKAIGYSNGFVVGVVLQEALLLSVLGFGPAFLASFLVYGYLGTMTGLPLLLTPGRVLFVLVLAAGMCMLSGTLALRKVIKADPAEVFA